MRLARWLIGIAGGLILLAVAAVITVTLLVDPNRFKGRIEAMVRETTGRPFEIRGDLDIAWFPWLAVRTGPAMLGNPAGTAGAPLVQWQSARVGARLIPLIHGRLVISRIRLEGLRASLHRSSDGRANWDDLLATGTKSEGNASVQIAGIEIRDGAIDYTDARSNTQVAVSDLLLDVGAWQKGQPFSLSTRFLLQQGVASAVRIPIALNVPKVQLQESPTASIPQFSLSVADAKVTGSMMVTSTTPLNAGGGLSIEVGSLRKLLAGLGVGGPRPRDGSTLGEFRIKAQWTARDGAVVVRPIEMRLDQTRFGGELVRSSGATPVWNVSLKGDRIALGRYTEIESASSEPFELPTAALKALRVQGVVSFDEAQLADMQMKNVRLRLELEDGRLHEP